MLIIMHVVVTLNMLEITIMIIIRRKSGVAIIFESRITFWLTYLLTYFLSHIYGCRLMVRVTV